MSEDLRRHNRALILELFSRHQALSRIRIAAETRLTGAAISRITRELMDAKLLVERENEEQASGRGRPAVTLELAANGGFVVGVGIGAYEQAIQIANLHGEYIARRVVDLMTARSPVHALNTLSKAISTLIRKTGVPAQRIFGVGVAIAGVVDAVRGVVLQSPNIGWSDVPLTDVLTRTLRLPVRTEAMHHALNLAESRFSGSHDVAVLVNAAMGIGASVMEHGRIIRGSHAAAGQIGHMHVAAARELCTCGRRGCLDTVASGYAVLRRLRLIPSRKTPKEHDPLAAKRLLIAIARERQNDLAAAAAFHACGQQLGEALNRIGAILDPGRVMLAGPLSQTHSYVKGVRAATEPALGRAISVAKHSSDAAAARLALSTFVFNSSVDLR